MKITIRINAEHGFRFLKKKYLPTAPSYDLNTCNGDGFRTFSKEKNGDGMNYIIEDCFLCESAREYNSAISRADYFQTCKEKCQEYVNRIKGLNVKARIVFTDEWFDGRNLREDVNVVFENGNDFLAEVFG